MALSAGGHAALAHHVDEVAAGENAHGRVLLRLGEAALHGAVSAHGHTGDEVVLPQGRNGKLAVDHPGKLLGHIVEVASAVGVGVERGFHRGHHHRNAALLRIAFHAGKALPHALIVGRAVEQPQNRQLAVVQPAFFVHVGQDHIHRRHTGQTIRMKVQSQKRHTLTSCRSSRCPGTR